MGARVSPWIGRSCPERGFLARVLRLVAFVQPCRLPMTLFTSRRHTPPSDVDGLIVEDVGMTETNLTSDTADTLGAVIKPRIAIGERAARPRARVIRAARCVVLKRAQFPALREHPAGRVRRADRPVS